VNLITAFGFSYLFLLQGIAMATTPHMGLTLVEQSQAQKEVTVNMALMRVDALLNMAAISKSLSTPPASAQEGDVYVVADAATDDWEG
jgi:hypothetical protein